jgi:hypothetical protein
VRNPREAPLGVGRRHRLIKAAFDACTRAPACRTSRMTSTRPNVVWLNFTATTDILAVICSRHPTALTRSQIATLSGAGPKSSTYANNLSILNVAALVQKQGDLISATGDGFGANGGAPEDPQTAEEVRALWRHKPGGASKLFQVLESSKPRLDLPRVPRRAGCDVTDFQFLRELPQYAERQRPRSEGLCRDPLGGNAIRMITLFQVSTLFQDRLLLKSQLSKT